MFVRILFSVGRGGVTGSNFRVFMVFVSGRVARGGMASFSTSGKKRPTHTYIIILNYEYNELATGRRGTES